MVRAHYQVLKIVSGVLKTIAGTVQFVRDNTVDLAATDGNFIFVSDRCFVMAKDGKFTVNGKRVSPIAAWRTIILHEYLHILLGHCTYRMRDLNANPTIKNIAMDHAVNLMAQEIGRNAHWDLLSELGIMGEVFPIFDGLFCDAKYTDQDAETILNDLIKKGDKGTDINEPEGITDGDINPDGDPTDADGDGDGDGDAEGDSTDGGGDADDDADGDADTGADGDADGDSTDGDGDGEGDGEGEGSSDSGSGAGGQVSDNVRYPDLEEGETPEEADAKARKKIKEAVRIHEMSKKAGLEEAKDGLTRKVSEAFTAKAKVPWQKVLTNWLKRTLSGGWDKPQNIPVLGATDLFSAGRGSKKLPEIAYIIDTSYSMSDAVVNDGLDQLENLMRQYKPKKTHVICCSTEVELNKSRSYSSNQRIDRSIITGGGGTRFVPAFEYVKRYHPNVGAVVYITDGECDQRNQIPQHLLPAKLLWVVYGGMKPERFKLGKVVEAPPVS
jgi:predicted metal-dependent peptidase